MKTNLTLACNRCMHESVCGKKHIFESAQKDLEQFNVLKIIDDKDWIKVQPLKCSYYLGYSDFIDK